MLMALSWFILRARYKVIHFVAVFVCLLGVGTMVGADILAGREDNSGETVFTECIRSCFQSVRVTLTESGWWGNSSEGEQGSMLWASMLPRAGLASHQWGLLTCFLRARCSSWSALLTCCRIFCLVIIFSHLIAFSHLSIKKCHFKYIVEIIFCFRHFGLVTPKPGILEPALFLSFLCHSFCLFFFLFSLFLLSLSFPSLPLPSFFSILSFLPCPLSHPSSFPWTQILLQPPPIAVRQHTCTATLSGASFL